MGRLVTLLIVAWGVSAFAQPRFLDRFESLEGWKTITTENVEATITLDQGAHGRALRVEYFFKGGSGYFILQKEIAVTLPQNYVITFSMRGNGRPNNLEFKFLDSTAENVWWHFRRAYELSAGWTKLTTKPRHVVFAWGPAGGGELKRFAKLEFAISAAEGGKGTLWFDDLAVEDRPSLPNPLLPSCTSSAKVRSAVGDSLCIDGHVTYVAQIPRRTKAEFLQLDCGVIREIGGVVLHWADSRQAPAYTVQLSDDGRTWNTALAVGNSNGGVDHLPLPETETRFMRFEFTGPHAVNLQRIDLKPTEFSSTPDKFMQAIAVDAPRGRFPRPFLREQSYWTVVGVNGDDDEALINEEGLVETNKEAPSLEPFLRINNAFITWNDVNRSQTLEDGYLPVPTVTWSANDIRLDVTPFAAGETGSSLLFVRYRVTNTGASAQKGSLYLALRPFQVNPPWQNLNTAGGVAAIRSLVVDDSSFLVNNRQRITFSRKPTSSGCASFSEGDAVEHIAAGKVPPGRSVDDPLHYASAAAEFPFELRPGASTVTTAIVPFHAADVTLPTDDEGLFQQTKAAWRAQLSGFNVHIGGPDSALVSLVRSTLGYVLVNRDRAGIQPGSRVYERSWIRDGAWTSGALLRLGRSAEVREFLDWYAGYQFASGKIPCVVDRRGADPVPEHDSHGEFIYAMYEYLRFTRDTTFLRKHYQAIVRAAVYMDTLRRQRMTPEYAAPDKAAYFGLMPESISHEGYSAKPMHSYWDDFFALRGLLDAVSVSTILGDTVSQTYLQELAGGFRRDVRNSLVAAIRAHSIDYVPGCVELGDFDATSTALAVNIGLDSTVYPDNEYRNTFSRYLDFFHRRASGVQVWENYTPYEFRIVNALVRLGESKAAHEVLSWLMRDSRPNTWNHWAEVVWKDPLTPRMIGDMPHTWCGTEFVQAVRSMFVYEVDDDRTLVIAGGLKKEWINQGVSVKDLPTRCGPISFAINTRRDNSVIMTIDGVLDPGTTVAVPSAMNGSSPSRIRVNGQDIHSRSSIIRINTLPTEIRFFY